MPKNDKRTLYVGGLEEDVTVETLRAAFIPFGDLVDVNIPLDNQKGTHRGFGFVEFESADDASEATFNMNNGELNGRVLTVNFAKPMTVTENSNKAIWHSADADAFFDKQGWGDDGEPLITDDGVADEGLKPKEA
mmetsp:Transcript_3114/g.7331  ORF Transcript_3114/g.7331 Transcript_3114/m.7331 type:complete len:135 (-) Transcript_3114:379-783(-)|eukprot:CAMPEP_0177719274 /NCGR_PEP_ID=MMETSP0484_2-20121128/16018_1 /TAXON_ID=354590 /ORGANISM="Rhodomonas lens, Strain RHODO" /LENGTH=134 /DNA_ID=CAMNT_0019231485 /DNA_START=163 /DNA_END=567 /DNA_ORIENTATION=+